MQELTTTLTVISLVIGILSSAFSLCLLVSKSFRNWIFGMKKNKEAKELHEKQQIETDRCLLRDRILSTYYKHVDDKELKYYEYENVSYMYTQYKELNGNSFIDKVWREIQTWKVDK